MTYLKKNKNKHIWLFSFRVAKFDLIGTTSTIIPKSNFFKHSYLSTNTNLETEMPYYTFFITFRDTVYSQYFAP